MWSKFSLMDAYVCVLVVANWIYLCHLTKQKCLCPIQEESFILEHNRKFVHYEFSTVGFNIIICWI